MPGAVCCPPTCDICSQKDTNSKPAEDSTAFNQQVDTWHAQGPVGTNPIRKLYIWKFHASLWKNKWPIDINRGKHLTGDQRQEGNNDALRQPSLNKKWMGKIEKLKKKRFSKRPVFFVVRFFCHMFLALGLVTVPVLPSSAASKAFCAEAAST